jgi:predicted secreted protein
MKFLISILLCLIVSDNSGFSGRTTFDAGEDPTSPGKFRTIRTGCDSLIKINRFDTLVIEFTEYPGRGYSWLLMKPDTALKILNLEKVDREGTGQKLDPEQKVWFYIVGQGKGEELLRFKYCRPWEKQKPGADSCRMRIVIR